MKLKHALDTVKALTAVAAVAFVLLFLFDMLLVAAGGEWKAHTESKNYRVVRNAEGQFSFQERRFGVFRLYVAWKTDSNRHATPEAAWADAMGWRDYWLKIKRSGEERARKDWTIVGGTNR